MKADSTSKGITNPQFKAQRIANPLERGTAINVVINMNKAYHGEISWTSFVVRTVVSGVEVGVAAIPMAGPILSSMIVCYDIGGGFDNTLYNDDWIHKTKP